jgi:GntR family transcriptional regulator
MNKTNGIDHFSTLPLYFQLHQIFRNCILSGGWKPGEQIPVQHELASTYEVSLAVVRQAVQMLVNEGLLVKRQGKGTFVIDFRIKQGPKKLTSFTQELLTKGFKPGSVLLEQKVLQASEKYATIFTVTKETEIILVKRLRTIDGEPLGIQSFFCPLPYAPDFLHNDLCQSLYELLEKKYRIHIVRAEEKYYSTVLDEIESRILKVKSPFAGFYVERTSYDTAGRIVEYTESIIRSDKYCVQIQLEK